MANLLRLSPAQLANIQSWDDYVAVSVRNLALHWRRMHRPGQHESLSADFGERVTDDFADRVADENEINFMLDQLPVKCRLVFVYYFAEGCTAREVAARLKISVGAVKNRLRRRLLKVLEARDAYRCRPK